MFRGLAFLSFLMVFMVSAKESPAISLEILYSHGIASNQHQVDQFQNNNLIPDGKINSFDYADVTSQFWRVNFWNTGFGKIEADRLAQEYQTLQTNNTRKVIVGLSRGASAIVNFMAGNPESIEALILESPFDSFDAILKNLLSKVNLDNNSTALWIAQHITRLIFWKYDPSYPAPVDHVAEIINKKLPILIIGSADDTLVPNTATLNLFLEFKKNGFENVHCAMLNGKHGKICLHTESLEKYKEIVRAFCERYDLPYAQKLASATQNLDELCLLKTQAESLMAAIKPKSSTNYAYIITRASLIAIASMSAYYALNYIQKNCMLL